MVDVGDEVVVFYCFLVARLMEESIIAVCELNVLDYVCVDWRV